MKRTAPRWVPRQRSIVGPVASEQVQNPVRARYRCLLAQSCEWNPHLASSDFPAPIRFDERLELTGDALPASARESIFRLMDRLGGPIGHGNAGGQKFVQLLRSFP